jgi:hypothetical protein
VLRWLVLVPAWLVALTGGLWAYGALHYDCAPGAGFAFAVVMVAALAQLRSGFARLVVVYAGFGLVLAWWLTLQPRSDRNWQADVAQVAWAEVNGDDVTVHNVRDCEYQSETNYTARWITRRVKLSSLTGIDMGINYWGSPWMAHPIVSFQFKDAPPLCFSIETRREVGEGYSAIGGLYRRYELIFIAAEERDVVRVRTNYRKGEDIYLYRLTVSVKQARERFLEYIASINALHRRARWYNAITSNCTTSIRAQHPSGERAKWDWRMLLNGKADEMMYERGAFRTDGLPFAELRQRAWIDEAAQAADASPDFSRDIRAGRPGFGPAP